jgi:hypothetical protein
MSDSTVRLPPGWLLLCSCWSFRSELVVLPLPTPMARDAVLSVICSGSDAVELVLWRCFCCSCRGGGGGAPMSELRRLVSVLVLLLLEARWSMVGPVSLPMRCFSV